jgi:hypothetical protein
VKSTLSVSPTIKEELQRIALDAVSFATHELVNAVRSSRRLDDIINFADEVKARATVETLFNITGILTQRHNGPLPRARAGDSIAIEELVDAFDSATPLRALAILQLKRIIGDAYKGGVSWVSKAIDALVEISSSKEDETLIRACNMCRRLFDGKYHYDNGINFATAMTDLATLNRAFNWASPDAARALAMTISCFTSWLSRSFESSAELYAEAATRRRESTAAMSEGHKRGVGGDAGCGRV